MAYDFNAKEIFEMAEQMEKNGVEFYTKAAENTTNDETKKLFIGLADMEKDHENTFSILKADLTGKEKESNVFDPEDESALYLKALVDMQVFFKKELKSDATLTEVLKMAIGAEKDSIVFYLGMKELVSESSGKARIDSIIKEEMMHIKLLAKLLAQA